MTKNQMALKFPHYNDYSATNFLEMPNNVDAMLAIKRFPSVEKEVLVIYGPPASGKTHLLHIWNDCKGDGVISAAHLNDVPFNLRKIAVDDLNKSNKKTQENLFYLFNHIMSGGGAMLIATDTPVAQMDLIPELKSRLLTATQVGMTEPTEANLQMLLVKWAHERQITLAPTVLSFILSRADRNASHLHAILVKLDELSMEHKRKITIPLVKESLKL